MEQAIVTAKQELEPLSVADRVGIFLSFICMIHCIATPFLIAFFPAVHAFHHDETSFHLVLAAVILFFALWAFIRGYRIHGQKSCLALGMFGVALLFGALFVPEITLGFNVTVQAALTTGGGLVLIIAHFLNIKDCRCACCRTECH